MAMARPSGHADVSWDSTRYPTARQPSSVMSHRRRLATRSEIRPPAGRLTRFMTAKAEAAAPATAVDRPQVVSKKVGRNDTAASSEPKVQAYARERTATEVNG